MSIPCHPRGAVLALSALALLAFSGGCGGADSTTAADTAGRSTEASKEAETTASRTTGPTKAVLHPVDGSNASGTISYKKPNGIPVIEIRLQGLKPISGEEQYVIWQLGSRHDMLPVASYYAGKDGRITKDIESSFEPFAFLEDGSKTNVLVTYVAQDDDWREGLGAGPNGNWDPLVVGKHLLEGEITGSFVGSGE